MTKYGYVRNFIADTQDVQRFKLAKSGIDPECILVDDTKFTSLFTGLNENIFKAGDELRVYNLDVFTFTPGINGQDNVIFSGTEDLFHMIGAHGMILTTVDGDRYNLANLDPYQKLQLQITIAMNEYRFDNYRKYQRDLDEYELSQALDCLEDHDPEIRKQLAKIRLSSDDEKSSD